MTDSTASTERRLERLQGLLLGTADVTSTLTELAHLATGVVRGPVSCGITLRHEHGLMTVGSSDGRAESLDESQYRQGDGPCLQSVRSGQPVDVPDLRHEDRWPEYVAYAGSTGLRCSLSLPLTIGADTFGALNTYGFERPHQFGPTEHRQLELFAAQAAGTLRVATRQIKDAALLNQMEESLRSRTVIDQALGIVMGAQRCTAAEAFELLRRQSQNSHLRLRDVASELITRTTGTPPVEGREFDRS